MGSGRDFPQTETSDSYYKDEDDYVEYSGDGAPEDLENNEYYAEPAHPGNHVRNSKWKRFGATIDRQFGILTGLFNIGGIGVSSILHV